MAEGLFRSLLKNRGDYEVMSAGVSAAIGQGANRETIGLLKKRGIELDGFKSQQITEELIDEATHVFAMTSGHLDALEDMFPEYSDKFYLTCEFVDLPGKGVGYDVPDPIGMGRKAYEETASVFDKALPAIMAFIDQTWQDKK